MCKYIIPLLLIFICGSSISGELAGKYIDQDHLLKLRFGAHSHWMQPWRAYLETVPAAKFIDSIGINFDIRPDKNDDPYLIAEMLSKYGFRHARIEIGWGNLDFENETIAEQRSKDLILACKKFGIRPLILLNAHHGAPCPLKYFKRKLTANANKGDLSIQLSDTTDLRIGYSGICDISDYWACEAIITKVEGNNAYLSKPLPKDIGKAGDDVLMAELKYRPFSQSDTEDYKNTISGWLKYTGAVIKYVMRILDTEKEFDKGFDIEIWNELSFGSNFLSINNYYSPKLLEYDEGKIWGQIVQATADYSIAEAFDFTGIRLCNGFSNTIPWPASSTEPERITALSHHPYAGLKTYPNDENKGVALDAFMNDDISGFIPSYSAIFPEYFCTALQTETSIRDMAPIDTDIYGTKHGRNARVISGRIAPCPMWITEVGIAPNEIGIEDAVQSLKLKAKTTARYYAFYGNKGVERLYLYAACAGDKWLGIVKDDFLEYTGTNHKYPADDSSYITPSLQVIKRMVGVMKKNLDPKLAVIRELSLDEITDSHNNYQFKGDGSAAHPDLFNRDVFAFLPYQVNRKRFVIPYYIMTRDVREDMPQEEYVIKISGVKGIGTSVSSYDPISGKYSIVKILSRDSNSIRLRLMAIDYPRMLVIQE